jgi:hypothetical protein
LSCFVNAAKECSNIAVTEAVVEQSFSVQAKLHTKARNRLNAPLLHDMTTLGMHQSAQHAAIDVDNASAATTAKRPRDEDDSSDDEADLCAVAAVAPARFTAAAFLEADRPPNTEGTLQAPSAKVIKWLMLMVEARRLFVKSHSSEVSICNLLGNLWWTTVSCEYQNEVFTWTEKGAHGDIKHRHFVAALPPFMEILFQMGPNGRQIVFDPFGNE